MKKLIAATKIYISQIGPHLTTMAEMEGRFEMHSHVLSALPLRCHLSIEISRYLDIYKSEAHHIIIFYLCRVEL